MNRPTDLIEKLKVSSKASDPVGRWLHAIAASPENIQALLRWLEVLERVIECKFSPEIRTRYLAEAARELEARDAEVSS